MKNMHNKGSLLLMAAVLLCPRVLADQITLKNGDRLTGTIVKSDANTLLIKTDSAGDVTVQWSAIDTVSSTQPLHVGLNGGQMIVGVVTTSEYCSHLFDGKSSS